LLKNYLLSEKYKWKNFSDLVLSVKGSGHIPTLSSLKKGKKSKILFFFMMEEFLYQTALENIMSKEVDF
jgi:hypothetical protein